MTCNKCEFFKVIQEPITMHGVVVDWGRVECKKHKLIADVRRFEDIRKWKCPDEQCGKESE